MTGRINAREETEDLQAWLDGDHALDDSQEASEGAPGVPVEPCWRSNMLIQILLRCGQASPTHTFVYLDRCVINARVYLAGCESIDVPAICW